MRATVLGVLKVVALTVAALGVIYGIVQSGIERREQLGLYCDALFSIAHDGTDSLKVMLADRRCAP